jgi:probable HAF family extracellular repeat protein
MRLRTFVYAIAATLLLGWSGSNLAQAQQSGKEGVHYKVTDLGTLGGSSSEPFGINIWTEIVGTSSIADDVASTGFLWRNGRMTGLPPLPGGSTSGAASINLFGQIVGEADNSTPGPNPFICFTPNQCRAVIWERGGVRDLGTLPGGLNAAAGWVNDLGQVVGDSEFGTSVDPINGFVDAHAALWSGRKIIDLGTLGGPASVANSINDFGAVTGFSQFDLIVNPDVGSGIPSFHAFLFEHNRMIDLHSAGGLGGDESFGASINNRRQVIGTADLAGNESEHAFLWQNGVMRDLGALPGDPDSSAQAINDTGTIVGWSGDGEEIFKAAIWKDGIAVDLNSMIPADTDLQLLLALGINLRGEIVGLGVSASSGEFHGFLLTPNVTGMKISNAATTSDEAESTNDLTAKPSARVKLPESLRRSIRGRNQAGAMLRRVQNQDVAKLDALNAASAITNIEQAPTNLTSFAFKRGFDDIVRLAWTDHSTDSDNYYVESCSGTTCANFSQIAKLGANATTDTQYYQFKSGLTFRFRVRAHGPGGYSSYSNIVTRTLP